MTLSDEQQAVADQYKKMVRMGLPEDAVRHKMNQDQVYDEAIVAAVFGLLLAHGSSCVASAKPQNERNATSATSFAPPMIWYPPSRSTNS